MSKDETIQVDGTMTEYIVQQLTDEQQGNGFTREYLKAGFLASAVDELFRARRQAGLTQSQVAEKMQTKQAAIARLEADVDGSMSLHRYVDFALACGMIPFDIKLVPLEAIRDFIIENPQAQHTQEAYSTWQLQNQQSTSFIFKLNPGRITPFFAPANTISLTLSNEAQLPASSSIQFVSPILQQNPNVNTVSTNAIPATTTVQPRIESTQKAAA
ncbi:MAG: helix-turn-helix domain-containing protein [Ktedonobacteraceae bacterium]